MSLSIWSVNTENRKHWAELRFISIEKPEHHSAQWYENPDCRWLQSRNETTFLWIPSDKK